MGHILGVLGKKEGSGTGLVNVHNILSGPIDIAVLSSKEISISCNNALVKIRENCERDYNCARDQIIQLIDDYVEGLNLEIRTIEQNINKCSSSKKKAIQKILTYYRVGIEGKIFGSCENVLNENKNILNLIKSAEATLETDIAACHGNKKEIVTVIKSLDAKCGAYVEKFKYLLDITKLKNNCKKCLESKLSLQKLYDLKMKYICLNP